MPKAVVRSFIKKPPPPDGHLPLIGEEYFPTADKGVRLLEFAEFEFGVGGLEDHAVGVKLKDLEGFIGVVDSPFLYEVYFGFVKQLVVVCRCGVFALLTYIIYTEGAAGMLEKREELMYLAFCIELDSMHLEGEIDSFCLDCFCLIVVLHFKQLPHTIENSVHGQFVTSGECEQRQQNDYEYVAM